MLPQPGVIHVPHSTFQTLTTSMTGVSVTTNVPSSIASGEDCVTSIPLAGSNVTDVNDREHINCTPTGLGNNVAEVTDRDRMTSTPTMVGNSVIDTKDNNNTENAICDDAWLLKCNVFQKSLINLCFMNYVALFIAK